MDEACALALELLGLDKDHYNALFTQGGASTQFVMAPFNFLRQKAAYLNAGPGLQKPSRRRNCLVRSKR